MASVNLLFDTRDEALTVTSALPLEGALSFRAALPLSLRVRVPEWVDPATLSVTVNRAPRSGTVSAGYVQVGALAAGDSRAVRFAVPVRLERETVDGIAYTTTWLGDQIVDIQPRGTVSPLPF